MITGTFKNCPKCGENLARLTQRESSIARLVAKGGTNRLIAEELGLTEGTVKEHVWHMFKKLGVANRTELAIWAMDPRNEKKMG